MSGDESSFTYSSSSASSPWTDNTSWQGNPVHNCGPAFHESGPWSPDLDTSPPTSNMFTFGHQSALPGAHQNHQLPDYSFYQSSLAPSIPHVQAFPQADFILFPEGHQGYEANYTPPPLLNQAVLQPSTTIPEPTAVRATRQLLYVDRATSPAEDKAERPCKKIKITRTKPVTEKRSRPRHNCKRGKCSKTFSRQSDLIRHEQDVHGLSNEYYECEVDACLHRTRRNDKMKEHCQKIHGHRKGEETFAVVSGGKEAGRAEG